MITTFRIDSCIKICEFTSRLTNHMVRVLKSILFQTVWLTFRYSAGWLIFSDLTIHPGSKSMEMHICSGIGLSHHNLQFSYILLRCWVLIYIYIYIYIYGKSQCTLDRSVSDWSRKKIWVIFHHVVAVFTWLVTVH